jgi:hypothetical protein
MASGAEVDEGGIPPCPICGGKLEVAYDRYHQKVVVCVDCHVGVTIPGSAWTVARLKRDGKWPTKTE